LEPILAAKILIFADIGKLFVLFFLFARLFVPLSFARFALSLRLCLEGTHARKYKKNTFFFVFCSLIRTFAADFKGCLRVQAEMIPSNLIRIIPA
jgi:hypothetical protein